MSVRPATGNWIFWVLHIAALLGGGVWLLLTVPLHLIYGALPSVRDPSDRH